MSDFPLFTDRVKVNTAILIPMPNYLRWTVKRFCTRAASSLKPNFTAIGEGDTPLEAERRCWENMQEQM